MGSELHKMRVSYPDDVFIGHIGVQTHECLKIPDKISFQFSSNGRIELAWYDSIVTNI